MAAFLLLMSATSPTVWGNDQDTLTPFSPDEEHIGRLIECTTEEKRCFTHSRILDKKANKCYIVGSRTDCPSGKWYLDKNIVFKTGRYVGKCLSQEPCHSWQVKQPNGDCVAYDDYCSNGNRGKPDLFGEPTCVSRKWRPPVVNVQQPQEPGLCRVPNFWNASLPRLNLIDKPFPCSQDELWCFIDNRIPWPGDGLCYEAGYREPCAQQGYWLVVDEEEYLNGTGVMTSVCRPRPCPEGHLLMDFDRKCHSREEVEQVLCSGEYMLTNFLGYSGCELYEIRVFPAKREINGTCIFLIGGGGGAGVEYFAPSACPTSNIGYCPRKVIQPKPSLPEL